LIIFNFIVEKRVKIFEDPYEAAKYADAIIVVTEWNEFKELDYQRIYNDMQKPAFLFDGRLILDEKALTKIGFKVEVVGKVIL
jgi:UDPglucose 6-dehydrogenase